MSSLNIFIFMYLYLYLYKWIDIYISTEPRSFSLQVPHMATEVIFGLDLLENSKPSQL